MTLSDFFHMGGYATYVWSAYGIWLVVMIVNAVLPAVRLRETRARLGRRLQQENGEA